MFHLPTQVVSRCIAIGSRRQTASLLWHLSLLPQTAQVYLSMSKVSSMPKAFYTPTKANWCEICGGRHQQHECSVHAPTEPPEHDAPDHSWWRYKWWPDAPNGATVLRGKVSMPPMASFKWRRLCHALLWIYSNTETGQMMPEIDRLQKRTACKGVL